MLSIIRRLHKFLKEGQTSHDRLDAFLEYQSMLIDPVRAIPLESMTVHDTVLKGQKKVALNSLMASVSPGEMFAFILYSKIVPGFNSDVLLVESSGISLLSTVAEDDASTADSVETVAQDTDQSDPEDKFSCQTGELPPGAVPVKPSPPTMNAISEEPDRSVFSLTSNSTGVTTKGWSGANSNAAPAKGGVDANSTNGGKGTITSNAFEGTLRFS